ncbi:tetratricopeptide repeat protein [Marinihelvus fidelis]|nr:tetratricopeptide repeat protein [Marinihelvus fidelis]
MGEDASGFRVFLENLKRRKVIRVAIGYAVAAFVLMQIADATFEPLNLPDWSATLVLWLLVLGFPVAIFMSWMLEVTPEGIKRTDADTPQGGALKRESAEPAAAAGTRATRAAPEPAPRPAPGPPPAAVAPPDDGRRSIAVLPFVNMSNDKENEYFSDGISEEILNLLVKLPRLRVASRTSSFAFKGKEASIPEVAGKLGVETVLEGSIRRAGDRVRITAQLIEASTDSHLWSDTYDRELKDVFAIQDDIAQSITDALEMTLTPKERRSIQNVATADAGAYDYYLRGRSYMYTMTKHDYEHAINMFKKAIVHDDKYALAFAGIADAYSYMFRYTDAQKENARSALEYSEKAVDMDPDSAEARASRGLAMFINERYEEAEEQFKRAAEMNPNLYEAWYYAGLAYSSQGKFTEAIEMYKKANQVNPLDYQSAMFLGQAYASLGQKHEEMKARVASIELIERHIEMNPHDTRALCIGANQLSNVGELERGERMVEEALIRGKDEPLVLYNTACFYAIKGDEERALELLEDAVKKGWGDRAWLETDSDLDAVREDPRFQALLDSID